MAGNTPAAPSKRATNTHQFHEKNLKGTRVLIPPVSRGPRTSGVLVFRQLELMRRLFVACLKQGAGAQTPGATPAQTLLQTRQQQICGCGSFAKLQDRCYVHGVIAHADTARCLISPAPRTPPKYLLHNLGVALTNAKQHMARDAPHPASQRICFGLRQIAGAKRLFPARYVTAQRRL